MDIDAILTNDISKILANFNLSELYKKDAYSGDIQLITLNSELLKLEIYQERLYKNIYSYKTNTIGEVKIKIYYNNEMLNISYNDLLEIINKNKNI